MTTTQILLFVGLVVVVLDSRTTLLAARGGMATEMAARNFLVVLLGGFALPAQLAILVGGFFLFDWYLWLPAVLAALLFLGLLVNRSTFVAFYTVSPVLNIVAIVCAVLVWGDYLDFIEI